MENVDKLRNVVLLSHGGAGKTALCEALLFNTKATTRLGKVEDGNTVSDYEPEEVRRAGSIQTALIPCNWDGHKLNFLDTPGYDDFVAEVISAMRVADGALILVAANAGVEVGTERSWSKCDEASIPRMVLINKMDRENADFQRSLENIQSYFGRKCVPFQIPIGSEHSFKGVVDLLTPPSEVPDDVADQVKSARERLIEGVAETDDDLATRYLEGEELSQEELILGIQKAVLAGDIVPVLVGSSTMDLGIQELLKAVVDYMPSPLEGKQVQATNSGGAEEKVEPDPPGTAGRLRLQDHRRPLRGQAVPLSRVQGNPSWKLRGLERGQESDGAYRPGIYPKGKDPGDYHGDRPRRYRSRGQAHRHGYQRHPVPAGPPHSL